MATLFPLFKIIIKMSKLITIVKLKFDLFLVKVQYSNLIIIRDESVWNCAVLFSTTPRHHSKSADNVELFTHAYHMNNNNQRDKAGSCRASILHAFRVQYAIRSHQPVKICLTVITFCTNIRMDPLKRFIEFPSRVLHLFLQQI